MVIKGFVRQRIKKNIVKFLSCGCMLKLYIQTSMETGTRIEQYDIFVLILK